MSKTEVLGSPIPVGCFMNKNPPAIQDGCPGGRRGSRASGVPHGSVALLGALILLMVGCGQSSHAGPENTGLPPVVAEFVPGVSYTNQRIAKGPWSIHVVRASRESGQFGFVSVHARQSALGLATLSQQVKSVPETLGIPVGAVNGDFYQRDRAYAGDPRGLQVVDGEMISAPIGGVALCINGLGQLQALEVHPRFELSWAGGSLTNLGFNEDRQPTEVVLYTPKIGGSTRTSGGREWVLVPGGTNMASAMAQVGAEYVFRVEAVKDGGDAPMEAGKWVLSAGQGVVRRQQSLASVANGAEVRIRLATDPRLDGVQQAISGGPILVRGGKALKIVPPRSDSYQFSSMLERHPRSAVGWNRTHLMLVQVDGRQPRLSVGMTLEELGATMARLGCEEAMNLDGGGSATFWCDGRIRNSPCDGGERVIANSLVLVRRAGQTP